LRATTLYLGDTDGTVQTYGTWSGAVANATNSDINLKHNIALLSTQYKQLFNALIPRLYQYNNGTSNRIHIGFIAQEVEEAIKNAGLTT
jgi:hypothetical protein